MISLYFYEGFSCPVCKRDFMKNEDVVACPQCGLPHHRECWKKVGHCLMDDKHGTVEQWSREKVEETKRSEPTRQTTSEQTIAGKICPHCHTKNAEYAEFCNHCGQQMQVTEWYSASPQVGEYTPFQSPFAPGEPYSTDEIIGSASAKELAAVVGHNTTYYIPRFRRSVQDGRCGWNWAAFLLGPYWLLFRKQYLAGIALAVLQLIYSFFGNLWTLPLNMATSQEEMLSAMETVMHDRFVLPIFVLSVIILTVHIILGLRGNTLYRYHCEKKIQKAKMRTPDLSSSELASVGGTSFLAAALCYFIPNILSAILMSFVTM